MLENLEKEVRLPWKGTLFKPSINLRFLVTAKCFAKFRFVDIDYLVTREK